MISQLIGTGLVRGVLNSFLRPRDVLSLARSSRCMFMECTRNALALSGRRRIICVENCELTAAAGRAACEIGAWEVLTCANLVVSGEEIMLAVTEHFRNLLELPTLRRLSVTLIAKDYFFWLLNLTLIVNDFKNSTGKNKLEELSIDFGSNSCSNAPAPAPVLFDFFESLRCCDKLKVLKLDSIPVSSGVSLKLPVNLHELFLYRWFSVGLVKEDLTGLTRLCISGCSLNCEQAALLFDRRTWSKLVCLELPDNLLSSTRFLFGASLPCLRKIDFCNNNLSEDFDSVLELLRRSPNLQYLGIGSNMIGETGLISLLSFCEKTTRNRPLVINASRNGIRIAAQVKATSIHHLKILFE